MGGKESVPLWGGGGRNVTGKKGGGEVAWLSLDQCLGPGKGAANEGSLKFRQGHP